jgi:hypothetical protein
MTWKIEVGTGTDRVLLGEILTAQTAWKRLSKHAREAVRAATTENILVYAHPLTIKSLERHGFVVGTAYSSRTAVLTDAGRAVAKWCVKP